MVLYSNFETKMQIKKALAEILLERTMSDITVSDICVRASVSRQTFYNHFSDKFAVPQWFFDLICHQYLYETGRSLSFRDAFFFNTQALLQNKDFLIKFSKPKGYQSLFSYGRRTRKQTLIETLVDFKGTTVTKELKDLVEYHVQGETQLVSHWVEEGMSGSIQYLTDLIMEAVPHKLLALLKDPTPGVQGKQGRVW
jgi:AcrR family transcriptional regulator